MIFFTARVAQFFWRELLVLDQFRPSMMANSPTCIKMEAPFLSLLPIKFRMDFHQSHFTSKLFLSNNRSNLVNFKCFSMKNKESHKSQTVIPLFYLPCILIYSNSSQFILLHEHRPRIETLLIFLFQVLRISLEFDLGFVFLGLLSAECRYRLWYLDDIMQYGILYFQFARSVEFWWLVCDCQYLKSTRSWASGWGELISEYHSFVIPRHALFSSFNRPSWEKAHFVFDFLHGVYTFISFSEALFLEIEIEFLLNFHFKLIWQWSV